MKNRKLNLNIQFFGMKKSQEMYNELKELRNKMESLQAQGKIEDAHAMIEEVKNLERAIEVQEELEKKDIKDLVPMPEPKKADKTVAFNKAVLGKSLTDAENALVERVGEDGGYLVPEEQRTQIEELKRQLIPLKQYCNVIPVGTLSGKMPLEVDSGDKLTNFDELDEIDQSTIKFGQVTWELKDYGDIIPISNTLLQDEKANLTNYVGRRFAKKAVRTENDDIIKVLKAATKKSGADYKVIQTAINKDLDPAIAANSIIITNQDGYDYLDTLVDENGRELLKDDLAEAGAKTFKGKKIVVMSNDYLKTTENKVPYFVGDISEFVAFFDRGVYDMAVSKEAGFTKYATLMRVVERFDVKKVDEDAVVYVEITPATEG